MSVSVHIKYQYSQLWYTECQFRYKHVQYKITLFTGTQAFILSALACRLT